MSEPLAQGRAHLGGVALVPYNGFMVGYPVYAALIQAEQQFGRRINLSSGYRTSGQQANLYDSKPGLAVAPGHSFHERGLAIDVDFSGWSADERSRFVTFMKSQGFAWGGDFSRVKEPWHFGYGEGGNLDDLDLGKEPAVADPTLSEMKKTLYQHLGFDPYADLDDDPIEILGLEEDALSLGLTLRDAFEVPKVQVQGNPNPYLQEFAMAAKAVGVPMEWIQSPALIRLIQKESSWDPSAKNPTSTAFGLGQLLRGTHQQYVPEVPYGTNDVYWQAVGTLRYIKDRYGSPESALNFHERMNWY